MHPFKHFSIFMLFILFAVGCGKIITPKIGSVPKDEAIVGSTEMAQAASESISTSLKDGMTLAQLSTPLPPSKYWAQFWNHLAPNAQAAVIACGLPESYTLGECSNQRETKTWNSCEFPGTKLILSGSVAHDYTGTSAGTCKLATNGTVTRKPDLTFKGRKDGTLTVTAETASDYRGNSVGGGQTLSRLSNTVASLTVHGIHRRVTTAKGALALHVSTRTSLPVIVTYLNGGTEFQADGGSLQVSHNLLKATIEWIPEQLQFNSSCACPVGGKLTGKALDALEGSMTIEYTTTCGKADVTIADETERVTLDSCL